MQTAEAFAPLPDIPRKRYFAIGEVSNLCLVKPHVLRYWEQEFPQLKPAKRRGNRRYYQHDDVLMVRHIRSLLYEQGFTIGGARQRLKDQLRVEGPFAQIAGKSPTANVPFQPISRRVDTIRQVRQELESLLKLLR